jgi:surfactin synthase thioesterase subunit
LDVPTLTVAGTQDALASPEMVQAWASLIGSDFATETLDAGHFFLSDHAADLARILGKALAAPDSLNIPKYSEERIVKC